MPSPRKIFRVRYTFGGPLNERFLQEVLMTDAQAREMCDLLLEHGAENLDLSERWMLTPPMTFDEAMQWIRRDF